MQASRLKSNFTHTLNSQSPEQALAGLISCAHGKCRARDDAAFASACVLNAQAQFDLHTAATGCAGTCNQWLKLHMCKYVAPIDHPAIVRGQIFGHLMIPTSICQSTHVSCSSHVSNPPLFPMPPAVSVTSPVSWLITCSMHMGRTRRPRVRRKSTFISPA
jgi:hypothetical protein